MSNLITVELEVASKNEVEFYKINLSKIRLMTHPPAEYSSEESVTL